MEIHWGCQLVGMVVGPFLSLRSLVWNFISQNWGTICTVIAELVVAWVIFLELRANRIYQALETIYDKHVYKGREIMYGEFFSVSALRVELSIRQEAFRDAILKESKLANACDAQIAQFTKLGYLLRRRWPWRIWEAYGPQAMIEFLPHVITPLAVMLVSYIEKRRQEKGRFYATHFIGLAIPCIRKIEDNFPHEITLWGEDRGTDKLVIKRPDLARTREQLQKLWSTPKAG